MLQGHNTIIVTEQACRLATAQPCRDEPVFILQDLDIHLLAEGCDMLVKRKVYHDHNEINSPWFIPVYVC